MIAGVERYQGHPFRRSLPTPRAIWRAGSARLLDYGAHAPQGAPAVLVVPSLVNRATVLDLHPRRSLLRWLAGRGLRPLLLDWGAPGREERAFGIDDYLQRRLLPAALAAGGGGPAAMLGYCMGGAFAAALAALRPDLVSRLALIGAPWDFSRLEGFGAALAAALAAEGRAAIEARIAFAGAAFGALPADAMQRCFAALDPTLAVRKFRRFAVLPERDPEVEIFVAAEDWLNDGPALAAPAARDIAVEWYLDNRPARGDWRVGGRRVHAGAIVAPTLAFCSRADRIAPPGCAEALPAAIPGAAVLRPRAGHVGMILGRAAAEQVWAPLARFLVAGETREISSRPRDAG